MQNVQRIKAVGGQKRLHLAGRRPPVVVVAFQQPFLARQVLDKGKIRLGVVQVHGPAGVARQDNGVLRAYELAPVGFQSGQVPLPPRENVHGLVRSQREVHIPDCKDGHTALTF